MGTHYFPDEQLGQTVRGWRNENIESQTFDDSSFDLVVTMDVTEHVFDPKAMLREIYRTLKPGGLYLSTFPIRKHLVEPAVQLARITSDGSVEHLKTPPEYHGNPIDGKGALVTWDFGYTIHQLISYWTSFDVEISRFSDRWLGVIGEYTEVTICRKRQSK
jgi:SAM-dependent methyltransferase